MKRKLPIGPLLAAVSLVGCLCAPAQVSMFREADAKTNSFVEVTSMFGKLPTNGYAPVRVTIANRSDRDRSISLNFRATDGYYGRNGSEMRSGFHLSAAAGRTEVVDLLVPVTTALNAAHGGQLSLRADMSGDFGGAVGSVSTGLESGLPTVLLSEPLFIPNASALDAETHSRFSAKWSGLTFAGRFDPTIMPEDWRAYAGYDVMMLTDDDWSKLSAGARTGILAWIRLGGRLYIHLQSNTTTLASLGIDGEEERSFGRIELAQVGPKLALDATKTVNMATTKSASFRPRLESLYNDTSAGWPLQRMFGSRAFNYLLFILVLVVFGVIVGPINLFVFARSGRRHRLFITTPLISLGASALLVALILMQDGFGGRGYRLALVEVRADGDEHAAYVHQEQISRTGVLLGSQFDLGEAALVSPTPLAPTRWTRVTQSNGGGGARYTIQPTGSGGSASGDWFQSRSEQGQILTSVIPTRGRIERLDKAGPPQVMSSFEFPIKQLFILTDDHSVWTATNVQPGRTATCTEVKGSDWQTFLRDQRKRFTAGNQERLDRVTHRANHFIALANEGPLPLVDTSDTIRWRSNEVVLTGLTIGRRAGGTAEGPSNKGQGPN